MKFIKFRIHSQAMVGDWDYKVIYKCDLPTKELLIEKCWSSEKEYIEDLLDGVTYSFYEGFRSVDYEIVDFPSTKWILNETKNRIREMDSLLIYIERLQEVRDIMFGFENEEK